ncbi:DUF2807 domain-containing protein [Chitinophaga silvatica]|uniref:DUF2807 domain-containing protein n=1 Tax=Chitinophaga silvatica TaxID=2282649 RepID=A0A3E1Y6J4_9BACT|nr:head GIN domain-containing protein [Chitinophaga silvatica]RFS20555.1 DUF2807 domain-containing protein [Chitinophaga silvatica]
MKKVLSICFAAALVAVTASLMSFNWFNEKVRGNGEIKEESRTASPFTSIATSGIYKVVIEQGDKFSVRVETDANLLPYVETTFQNNTLEISSRKGYDLNPSKAMTVYVTMKELESLSGSGVCSFTSKGSLKSDRVKIGVSGASNIDLDLKVQQLKVGLSGAAHIQLSGSATTANFGVSGAGEIRALDLAIEEAEVGVSGSGQVNLSVNKRLKAGVSGAGHVRYKGDATVNPSVSGAGSIKKI